MSTNASFPWLAGLLQVGDTAFPTGGYAHSYGFEEVVRLGLVKDEETLRAYLVDHVWPMLVHFELPVVRFAREAALNDDQAELLDLDACVDATKTAGETREASRATGRRRLAALIERENSPVLAHFARAIKDEVTPGHHSVVYGAGLVHVPAFALLTSWAYQSLGGICMASPKLLRIGQNAVQRVLTDSLASVEENVTASLIVGRDELGWFDPLTEIASMQHEIAHERLFIS